MRSPDSLVVLFYFLCEWGTLKELLKYIPELSEGFTDHVKKVNRYSPEEKPNDDCGQHNSFASYESACEGRQESDQYRTEGDLIQGLSKERAGNAVQDNLCGEHGGYAEPESF